MLSGNKLGHEGFNILSNHDTFGISKDLACTQIAIVDFGKLILQDRECELIQAWLKCKCMENHLLPLH
jgi:hypothetical protein